VIHPIIKSRHLGQLCIYGYNSPYHTNITMQIVPSYALSAAAHTHAEVGTVQPALPAMKLIGMPILPAMCWLPFILTPFSHERPTSRGFSQPNIVFSLYVVLGVALLMPWIYYILQAAFPVVRIRYIIYGWLCFATYIIMFSAAVMAGDAFPVPCHILWLTLGYVGNIIVVGAFIRKDDPNRFVVGAFLKLVGVFIFSCSYFFVCGLYLVGFFLTKNSMQRNLMHIALSVATYAYSRGCFTIVPILAEPALREVRDSGKGLSRIKIPIYYYIQYTQMLFTSFATTRVSGVSILF
jgi:hypothetical protein